MYLIGGNEDAAFNISSSSERLASHLFKEKDALQMEDNNLSLLGGNGDNALSISSSLEVCLLSW